MASKEIEDKIAANLKKLPEVCYAVHPVSGETVLLHRNTMGYTLTDRCKPDGVNVVNELLGVNENQVQAMLNGSMFGWHVPGADPDVVAKIRAANKKGCKCQNI